MTVSFPHRGRIAELPAQHGLHVVRAVQDRVTAVELRAELRPQGVQHTPCLSQGSPLLLLRLRRPATLRMRLRAHLEDALGGLQPLARLDLHRRHRTGLQHGHAAAAAAAAVEGHRARAARAGEAADLAVHAADAAAAAAAAAGRRRRRTAAARTAAAEAVRGPQAVLARGSGQVEVLYVCIVACPPSIS
jgi:hypothetical protein